jgi:Zn-dependent protease with chaperone function
MGVDKEIEIGLDEGFNAYTYGLDKPKIGIGLPLFDYLSVGELKSIIAHEIGHIKNKDQGFDAFISITLGTFAILSDWSIRLLGFGINIFQTMIVILTASLVGDAIASLMGWLVEIVAKIFMFIISAYLWIINKLLQLTTLVFVRQREFTADLHTTAFETQNKPQFFKNALGKLSLLSEKEAEFEKEVFEKRAKTAKEKNLKASDIYKKPHIKEFYSWLEQKNFEPVENLIDSEIIQKDHGFLSKLKSLGHTHPLTADRIKNINSLMTQYPSSTESKEIKTDAKKASTLITEQVYKEAISALYENKT